MIRVEFNAPGAREAIRNALATLSDMTPIFNEVGSYMVDATKRRFIAGRAPDGTPWVPKSKVTLERYRRMGYGSATRPLIGMGQRLSRDVVKFVARDGVLIGSSLNYSGVMQRGAARGAFGTDQRGRPVPWGRIPARVWLGIGREDELAIIDIVDEHLKQDLTQRD